MFRRSEERCSLRICDIWSEICDRFSTVMKYERYGFIWLEGTIRKTKNRSTDDLHSSVLGGSEFQTKDTDQYQEQEQNSGNMQRFLKQDNAHQNGSNGADPRPNRIGSTQRKRFGSGRKEIEANNHTDNGADSWNGFGKAMRKFHHCGPNHLKYTCNTKIKPWHTDTPPFDEIFYRNKKSPKMLFQTSPGLLSLRGTVSIRLWVFSWSQTDMLSRNPIKPYLLIICSTRDFVNPWFEKSFINLSSDDEKSVRFT